MSPVVSPVHRAPAAAKLAALGTGLVALALWPGPGTLAAGAVLLAGLLRLARLPVRALAGPLRPALWAAVAVGLLQLLLAGPGRALTVTGTLLLGVAAAGLVTLTTRTTDLLDVAVRVLRPLRRLGVDPERAGLVLALAVRSVPVLAELAAQVRDARRARGAERSVRALAVPLVIRTVRHADRLGEALAARGVDD